jgi:chromosome segregation ATPase
MAIENDHEAEIKAWASAHRDDFPNRAVFNAKVCTMLAQRGIPPLAATVLRVGGWGSTSSVATDVSQWYASIGDRLAKMEAEIPLGARSAGNQLLEQLWACAKSGVYEQFVRPLQEQLAQAQAQLQQASTKQEQLVLEQQQAELRLADEIKRNQEAAAELLATQRRWEKEQLSWHDEKTGLRDGAIRLETINLSLTQQIKDRDVAHAEVTRALSAAMTKCNGLEVKMAFTQERATLAHQENDRLRQEVLDAKEFIRRLEFQKKELENLYQKALNDQKASSDQCKKLSDQQQVLSQELMQATTAKQLVEERANHWQQWSQQAQADLKTAQKQVQEQMGLIGDLNRQLERAMSHAQKERSTSATENS